MNKKQLRQAHVLRNYNEGKTSRKEAAEALGKSERQITRLAKGMKEEGESALIHKNTGRKPAHALGGDKKSQIMNIRGEPIYEGCNISHFREILEGRHGIKISYKALYNLLKSEGVESPKKHHKATKAHRRRKRKAQSGALLQIDATPYEWFGEERKYALHGSIDDATGKITGLYMTDNECLNGYLEVIRQTIHREGIPLSLYSDKHTIFRSPKTTEKEAVGEEVNLTQFGRAMDELGINIIYANSPQAKGRVERMWETLQSRLPVEFRMRGIKTMECANEFLQNEYLDLFNERFSIPAEEGSIFLAYEHRESLDNILCVKETRTADSAGSFSYKNQPFKILDEGYPLIPARAKVTVLISTREAIQVQYKERIYKVIACEKPIKTVATKRKKAMPNDVAEHVIPHLKYGSESWKKIWHMQDYMESLAFLYDVFLRDNTQHL